MREPRRVAAVIVAIIISVGYLAASVTLLATEQAALEKSVIARTANTDAVVTLTEGDPHAIAARIRATPGVRSADVSFLSHGRVTGSSEWLQLQSVPTNPAHRWADLVEGRWPEQDDEIALGTTTAQQLNLTIGDEVTVNDSDTSATLRVTGITQDGKSLLAGLTQNSFVAPSYFSVHRSLQTEVLVTGDASTVDVGTVETTTEFIQRKMSEQTSGVLVFQVLLLVFGAIALLVGGILIVNTFLILVAQRRREIGLLRAIGASGAQVRRKVVTEGLVVGTVGSALGVVLGVVVIALTRADVELPVVQLGAVFLTGLLITVLAVLVPARHATRITPLDALRAVPDERSARRTSTIRNVAAATLIVGGLAAIGFGDSLLLSVGGSFLCAIGLLTATGIVLPGLLKLMGVAIGRLGPTARLAAANAVRNPGRAATTGAALVLAVGLVVTLQVGAASMKATALDNLGERFPIDVTVSMFDGALPDRTVREIAAIPGITETTAVRSTRASVGSRSLRVLGPSEVADNVILADPYLLLEGAITITGKAGTVTLPVRADFLAPAESLVVSPDTLATLDPHATVGSVWATTSPDADITELRSRLRTITAPIGAEVGGSLSAKASYTLFLDRILAITTLLLAVAVLIALIGVGNTLGLSVLERTRESALLRALGLERAQLRWMLAYEAVLLSLAGTVVGIAAGVFFGWVGTRALSAELHFDVVHYDVSVPQTLAVAGIAVVAGIAASVLPARAATLTRMDPSQ